jgi:hypothetical protein
MAAPTDQLSFSISTTITINPLRGINSTPVLTVAPIDEATQGERWVHNPGAVDAEGDSLSYKLVQPQYQNPSSGVITNVPGYQEPHLVDNCRNATNTGAATFTLDPITGQLTWDAPCRLGEYNVAFVVEEWRVSPGGGAVLLSRVVRDMQILVVNAQNRPPVLVPRDTCIVAGSTLSTTITATDPDNHLISLTVPGTGGILPPATFRNTVNVPGRAAGRLVWNTTCEDVRAQPYQLVFRAEDNPPPPARQLADLQPYRITVVGPPPQNLVATAQDRNVRLTWDQYTCQNASTIRIYRREGPSGFVPGPCETGVPASTGYVLIGEVGKEETEFLDDNQGEGLAAGAEYCYIIYAEFALPNGGRSIASVEACVALDRDIPYLTHVTVDRTDATNGQITVRWTQPGAGIERLNAPFEYRLYRKEGQQPGGAYQQVFSSRSLTDTVFVNTGLNTEELAYRYKLEFYSSTAPGGATPDLLRDSTSASSVRLEAQPASTQTDVSVALNWTYNVPWRNEVLEHQVYRVEDDGDLVEIGTVTATATGGTFTDQGSDAAPLERGKTYCYVVRTQGSYQIEGLPEPLQNFSQRVCVELPRIVCAPVLSIDTLDCEAFLANPTQPPYQNVLTWVPQLTGDCTDEIDFYTVYFRGPGEEAYREIARTKETTYTHGGLESYAGCYQVTATSLAGEESPPSNEVCKDNCIFFLLPNIITPNGDGLNDVFRPDKKTAFIKSMKFSVFNRWGVKVYESSSVAGAGGDALYINWPGVDRDGNRLTDGIYYYEAEVEFFTIDPTKEKAKYKGWVEIVR